jgi:hypothetical protein
MRKLGSQILVSKLLVFMMLLLLAIPREAHAATIEDKVFEDDVTSPAILSFRQFTTSDGHILGFAQRSVVVASLNHSLQIDLVGARAVAPEANGQAGACATPPLTQVTYTCLWDHVTAVFEAHTGSIFKSTYFVDATSGGSPSEQIRLRYNRPE